MNENFKKQVSDTDDLVEIGNILTESTELQSSIAHFSKNPCDSLFSKDRHKVNMHFNKKGDTIYLLGDYKNALDDNSSILEILYDAIEQELVSSAHTLNGNGLFFSLIEACAINKVGFDITGDAEISDKEFLFKGTNTAILISVNASNEGNFVDFIYNNGIELTLLGHVTKGELRMDDLSFGYIKDYLG